MKNQFCEHFSQNRSKWWKSIFKQVFTFVCAEGALFSVCLQMCQYDNHPELNVSLYTSVKVHEWPFIYLFIIMTPDKYKRVS